MAKIQRPRPSILDSMEDLGFINGNKLWRSACGRRFYSWDSLHGEIEVYNQRGKHIGVVHAVTGKWIKDAVKGRTINVS